MQFRLVGRVLSALVLTAFCTHAGAATVYMYQGNVFTENVPSGSTQAVAGKLTLSEPLPGELGSTGLVDVTSFAGFQLELVSDGDSFEFPGVDVVLASVSTDAGGMIVDWSMQLAVSDGVRPDQLADGIRTSTGRDLVFDRFGLGGFNEDAPGDWTLVSAVPLPGALLCLASALFGIGAIRRSAGISSRQPH